MLGIVAGALSGATMALLIEHSIPLLTYITMRGVCGSALVLSIMLFCAVRS